MNRRTDRQMGLLEKRPVLPSWKALPPECREEVLRILVQMFRDVAVAARGARLAAEVDDE